MLTKSALQMKLSTAVKQLKDVKMHCPHRMSAKSGQAEKIDRTNSESAHICWVLVLLNSKQVERKTVARSRSALVMRSSVMSSINFKKLMSTTPKKSELCAEYALL